MLRKSAALAAGLHSARRGADFLKWGAKSMQQMNSNHHKIPCKNLAKMMDFHRKWCPGGPDRVQDHLRRTKSAREGPTKRAPPQFWEANSLPRHLWGRFRANSGSPGVPEMVKIHKKSLKRGFEKRVDLRSSFWKAPGLFFHVFF